MDCFEVAQREMSTNTIGDQNRVTSLTGETPMFRRHDLDMYAALAFFLLGIVCPGISDANIIDVAPPPGSCYALYSPTTSPFSSVFKLFTFPGVTGPGIYGWTQ